MDKPFLAEESQVVDRHFPIRQAERGVPGGREAVGAGHAAQSVGAVAAHPHGLAGAHHRTRLGQNAEEIGLARDSPPIAASADRHRTERRHAQLAAWRASGERFGLHPTG